MAKPSEAGLWLSFAGSQAESIARSIEQRNSFSTVVVSAEVDPRLAELVVVDLRSREDEDELPTDDEFGAGLYLGVSQAGREVATGQKTIVVSNLIRLPELSPEAIRSSLTQGHYQRCTAQQSDVDHRCDKPACHLSRLSS